MKRLRLIVAALGIACAIALTATAWQSGDPPQKGALTVLAPAALRPWLTYISSDELEGRDTFSEGLGLAASYIADRMKDAGVKPSGDGGSYFQRVAVNSVRSISHSTLTIEVNGRTRTFADGAGVKFPKNVGGKRTLVLNDVEFVGYGLNAGPANNDYRGRDVKGKAVVWIGARGPKTLDANQSGRLLYNRAAVATEEMGAAATLSSEETYSVSVSGADFITTQRLDSPIAPNVYAGDDVLDFLFAGSGPKYSDLRALGDRQDTLPTFTLRGVKLTFNLHADYQIVRTQYTRNVVGTVQGTDPQLKDTYVAFGAHYDHLGSSSDTSGGGTSDVIFNGADDDGSGTAALIGIARAFSLGPKPRRSLLFIWHAGEEKGLYGSRYFADYPAVPLDQIVAQLNMDMIGRNRDDKPSQANTVLTVGSDRISTELNNIMIDANASQPKPLVIDFDMNDPSDPERIYYRSDHYSYAAKGIPVIFFFTGLHSDYHQVTDSVEKIDFEKLSRIGLLVYETGRIVADLDHAPARDFKGPRLGKGVSGKLPLD